MQSGAIGPVREVHVWVSRAWGWQSEEAAKRHKDIVCVSERPAESQPVPEGLDWDLWLGPAPARPFNSVYFPGPKWYRWWDFGNGTMSDLGSHWNDLPFWALKLQAPLTVEASGPPPHPEIAPASMSATYEYGAARRPARRQAHLVPGREQARDLDERRHPQVGQRLPVHRRAKGCCWPTTASTCCCRKRNSRASSGQRPRSPRSPGHHAEWLQACKTGQPTSANFEYSGWLTEANHLGNVAYRVGKKLQWNPKLLKATNAPEAERFIHRKYRKGWKL